MGWRFVLLCLKKGTQKKCLVIVINFKRNDWFRLRVSTDTHNFIDFIVLIGIANWCICVFVY